MNLREKKHESRRDVLESLLMEQQKEKVLLLTAAGNSINKTSKSHRMIAFVDPSYEVLQFVALLLLSLRP